jgi:hypothetical protein
VEAGTASGQDDDADRSDHARHREEHDMPAATDPDRSPTEGGGADREDGTKEIRTAVLLSALVIAVSILIAATHQRYDLTAVSASGEFGYPSALRTDGWTGRVWHPVAGRWHLVPEGTR